MWIHNAQLTLQVTFTLSVLNLTCVEQKLLPCATYFYGTLWFAQEAEHKQSGGSCGSWPRALARLDRSLVRLILSLPGLVYKDRVPLSPDQLWSSWFKAFCLRGIEREQLSQVKRDEPSWHLCHHLQRLQGKTLLWTDSSNKCSGTSVGKYVVNWTAWEPAGEAGQLRVLCPRRRAGNGPVLGAAFTPVACASLRGKKSVLRQHTGNETAYAGFHLAHPPSQ